jgi:opacity protein-like surface antigen
VRFYGDLELGIFTYWTKASGQIIEATGIAPVPERSEFRSEPGGSLGLGVLFGLNETLSLDAGIRYSFVKDSEYASYTGSSTTVSVTTSQVLDFALGLSYALPI